MSEPTTPPHKHTGRCPYRTKRTMVEPGFIDITAEYDCGFDEAGYPEEPSADESVAEPEGTYEAAFEIEGNLFDLDTVDPIEAAKAAWEQIRYWVETGYEPVIGIRINGSDTTHTVDLESEEIR